MGEKAPFHRRQIAVPTYSQSEWLLSDLDAAIRSADTGSMQLAARLANATRRDGVIAGVLSTRTQGMLSLPREITGDPTAARKLQEDFDVIFPMAELQLLLEDAILLRVAVGEFIQETWARLPTLRRLDPEYLQYRWSEDAWFYVSTTGLQRITPGDGRWLLHLPGGHIAPWKSGLWQALGRSYIAKLSAFYLRENYSQKLANAARVGKTATGTSNEERDLYLAQLFDWGPNASFVLPPGYELDLVESNGRGYEVFSDTIEKCDRENVIALSGQTVTLDGGAGFQNGAIFSAIRNDLIQADALSLASTLMSQGIPLWALCAGTGGLGSTLRLRWETTPPKDRTAEATAAMQAANAVAAWVQVGVDVDVEEMARRYGVALRVAPPTPVGEEPIDLLEEDVITAEVEPNPADELALKMTEHGIERCQHGANNRCPRCGIERVRDFDLNPDGSHAWKVIWRAIPDSSSQPPEV